VTGLCVDSCREMMSKIRERSDELSSILTEATLADRRRLIEIVLEDCLVAEEISAKTEPLFEVAALAEAWISGEDYPQLRSSFSDEATSTESISNFIDDVFQYRMPWGISAYIRLATKELGIDQSSLSS